MPTSPEKLPLASMDVAADKQRLLRQLFPEAFTETTDENGADRLALDFEKLKAVLGEHGPMTEPGQERYGLDWPGKRDALRAVQAPSYGTLIPAPEESVDWEKTQNVFIEGDNLEVLKLLQKSYYGKVKMIYIDPPYNTGNDFVYPDNYAESLDTYLKYTGQIDDQGFKTTTNSKDSGRFHSNWLRMMYPRLYVAKNLLREDGVLLISIDDNEVANLRHVCDQIFGEENFVGQMVWQGGRKNDAKLLSESHDYILIYSKSKTLLIESSLTWREEKEGIEEIFKEADRLRRLYQGDFGKIHQELLKWFNKLDSDHPALGHRHFNYVDSRGVYFPDNLRSPNPRPNLVFDWKGYKPHPNGWAYGRDKMAELDSEDRIYYPESTESRLKIKSYLHEHRTWAPSTVFYKDRRVASKALVNLMEVNAFDFPKDPTVLSRIFKFITEEDDLIVDFFAGSGTGAHAVMSLNAEDGGKRRSISVQLPEPCDEASEAFKAGFKTIAEISKERIRRAGSKIRAEWEEKNAAREAAKALDEQKQAGDLFSASSGDSSSTNSQSPISNLHSLPPDTGFRVFKLAPSNFRRWDGEAAAVSKEALEQQLEASLDHIATGATEESILFEILLKAGYQLTCPMEKLELGGQTVYAVDGNSLFISVADRINKELIDAIAEKHPVQFICLDRALQGSDSLKVNTLETFRAAQPEIQFRTV
jgi:adenine-specific DNA-methyltransferase